MHRFEVGGRVEHFLHSRPALRAFVADQDNITGLHLTAENPLHGGILTLENTCRAAECPQTFFNPGRFDDATLLGQIAVEHGQPAILRVGVGLVTDATLRAVKIQRRITLVLREGDLAGHTAWCGLVELGHALVGCIEHHVPGVKCGAEGCRVHGRDVTLAQPGTGKLAKDAVDATSAVYVLDVVFVSRRGDLAQAGNAVRQAVDVSHGEIHPGFLRNGQQVQHRIGRTAHRHIKRHGVFKGSKAGDAARQHREIVLFVVAAAHFDNLPSGLEEQLFTFGVGGHQRPVAGQRQTQGFGQAVHRIGGEHARARTAGRAGRTFDGLHVAVGNRAVGRLDHRVDEVKMHRFATQHGTASLHRATGNKNRRDIDAHRRHQHAGGDLVAVRDAHHGVGAMGVDHVFDRIGDEIA